jgi:hypothetical protein
LLTLSVPLFELDAVQFLSAAADSQPRGSASPLPKQPTDGDRVGIAVGLVVGAAEGAVDGDTDGDREHVSQKTGHSLTTAAIPQLTSIPSTSRHPGGSAACCPVCTCPWQNGVGPALGIDDGATEGVADVGTPVGSTVGVIVGSTEGLFVGATDGDTVGDGVGATVVLVIDVAVVNVLVVAVCE